MSKVRHIFHYKIIYRGVTQAKFIEFLKTHEHIRVQSNLNKHSRFYIKIWIFISSFRK